MNFTRRNFVKLSGMAAGTAAFGGVLSGCNSQVISAGSGAGSTSAAASGNKVVLGYWGGTCEAPIYIGYEKGYFKEAGLDPELLLITSDVTALMANSELDCFELTPDKFKPMEQGMELAIIDSLHIGCIQGAASAASGVKTVTDLEGKKIAISAMGSIPQIQISSQMVLAGKDPSKVEWLVYPSAQMEVAMNAGEVDGFAQYDPWADIAVANGATKFFSDTFDEGLKDYLCCFVGMSTKTLSARPDIGPMLSEGFAKAADFLNNNPEEAADIIVEAGYVPVNTDAGFTRDIMLEEIKAYTWSSGDRQLIDDSFHEIWMQINRAGAMEDAPKDAAALDKYIDETLYNKMVKYQGK